MAARPDAESSWFWRLAAVPCSLLQLNGRAWSGNRCTTLLSASPTSGPRTAELSDLRRDTNVFTSPWRLVCETALQCRRKWRVWWPQQRYVNILRDNRVTHESNSLCNVQAMDGLRPILGLNCVSSLELEFYFRVKPEQRFIGLMSGGTDFTRVSFQYTISNTSTL